MNEEKNDKRPSNLRLALMLAAVALAFYGAFIFIAASQ
jgi:hypothetical protein